MVEQWDQPDWYFATLHGGWLPRWQKRIRHLYLGASV